MYAAHLVVNQRVLYDVPAPTVVLYTLSAMAVTVSVGYGGGRAGHAADGRGVAGGAAR